MKNIIRQAVTFLLITWPALAGAEQSLKPDDFAFGTTLETDGQSSVYETKVPLDLYKSVTRSDLGDVRVFNADGAMVPFTIASGGQTEEELVGTMSLDVFPIRQDANQSPDALTVMIHRGSSGSGDSEVNINDGGKAPAEKKILYYLISTGDLGGPVRALTLYWAGTPEPFVKTVSVESSDDLKNWRTLTDDAVVSQMTVNNLGLNKNRVEFPAAKATYLRLKVQDAAALVVSSVSAEYVTGVKTAEREWLTVPGAAVAGQPRLTHFAIGARLPIDRAEVLLPEGNHMISADLYSSDKTDNPTETDRSYQYSGVLYRLKQSGHELTTGAIQPTAGYDFSNKQHWFLGIREESSDLDGKLPSLKLGWIPQKIVFVAQGKGPYVLAYGSGLARKPLSEVESLLGDNSGIAHGTAKLGARKTLGGESKLLPPPPTPPSAKEIWGKRAALAGMVLATLLLAWMAYRLARQMT